MDTVLTRSDGVVMQGSLQKPGVNDQITMVGTEEVSEMRADRIPVFITLVNGDMYLIYDQILPCKSRGKAFFWDGIPHPQLGKIHHGGRSVSD